MYAKNSFDIRGYDFCLVVKILYWYRADSRLVLSQWETSLQCNAIPHWLGTKLISTLLIWLMRNHGTGNSRQNINQIITLRWRQNGYHCTDNIFKCIFLNENVWISIKISLRFDPKGPINNILALVQIIAWRRSIKRQLLAISTRSFSQADLGKIRPIF